MLRLIRRAASVSQRPQLLGDRARFVGHFGTGVQRRLPLDEHDVALVLGHRVVAYALRHDERFALAEHDGSILHLDAERAFRM